MWQKKTRPNGRLRGIYIKIHKMQLPLKALKLKLSIVLRDERKRFRMQLFGTYALLGVVALFMSVVNLITQNYVLMGSTLAFFVLCGLNLLLGSRGEKWLRLTSILFAPEFLALFIFFIVSGRPEGFSAIWCCMVPFCSLLLFGKKNGSIMSGLMFGILVFFFWTHTGKAMLRYDYNAVFMLRFPFLYFAFFMMALLLETIRAATFANYIYSSTHDGLTGALNRVGFTEHIESILKNGFAPSVGFVIFDLDHFKHINDTYGHFTGDEVLKETKRRLETLTGLPLCRWGGEEFALLSPAGGLNKSWAKHVVEGFSSTPFTVDDKVFPVTVSLGAVVAERSPQLTADMLGLAADKCLYEAKESGRNRGVFKKLEKKDGGYALPE